MHRNIILMYFFVLVVVDGFECPAGEFKFNDNCDTCPDYTSSPPGSQNIRNCTCLVGHVARSHGLSCSPCEAGTFKNVSGAGICYPCHPGSTSLEASTASTDCNCQAGYEHVDDFKCNMCDIGKFKEHVGNGMCTSCSVSFTTQGIGSTNPNCTCPSNAYKPVDLCTCKPGAFMNISNKACILCPRGTYNEVGGDSTTCTPCSTLYNTQSDGSSSQNDCKCDIGLFHNEMNQCEKCPVRTYNPKIGAQGIEQCLDCPYRHFQPVEGKGICIPLFVNLKSPVEQSGRVVGLFVEGDTSCAYISRNNILNTNNTNDERTVTHKICWGLLTVKHPSDTKLDSPPIKRLCGDGILHPSFEQCDDGNTWNGDGCSDTCALEKGFFCEARVITANITESLFRPSNCCRISNGPAMHTPKCKRCGGRPSPFHGTRFRTRNCDLVDVNECVDETDGCLSLPGGVVCVNHDAIANNGSRLFSCDCPPGKFMSSGTCISERFATRFVIKMDLHLNTTQGLDTTYHNLKRYVTDEVFQSTNRKYSTEMVELDFENVVGETGTEQVTVTVFVDSWTAMQDITTKFDMTRFMLLLESV
jgi:cysteine-rich repeat protein